jgi:hypothetical protein
VNSTEWRAAIAELDGDIAGWRTSPFLHVLVTARMVRRNPCWLWLAGRFVRRRAANESWQADVGEGTGRLVVAYFVHLGDAWKTITGGADTRWRTLMRERAFRIWGNRPMLAAIKLERAQTLGADAKLLVVMLRRFYWLQEFWTGALPLLLLPHPLVKRGILSIGRRTPRGG